MPYSHEHREKIREKVVQSARLLFNRHGFNGVSIDQIMADAGLTRGGESRRWGYQLGATLAVKAAVGIPVIANGGITDPGLACDLIGHGLIDAVGLARPLLADPDWPAKVRDSFF